MIASPLDLKDVLIIKPQPLEDERGFFFESYNQKKFDEIIGYHVDFVQENQSKSKIGVLRGLHYQLEPKAQGKLIRVIRGAIFDVALDIRRSSPTFGKWVASELHEDRINQIWIPAGFAHGFLTLSKTADVVYKVTDFYSPKNERTILWSDPDISIEWPLSNEPIVSEKDKAGQILKEIEIFD